MATGTLIEREKDKILAQQRRAWLSYGWPGKNPSRYVQDAVGEVRYVVGWLADQMTRIQWRLTIDDSEEWAISLPDGTVVRPETSGEDEDQSDVLAASEVVLDRVIGWTSNTVRQVTTNLFVAGECHYVATDDDEWSVVSVIHPDRREILADALHQVRGLWPHPADPSRPDAPLFAVLEVLEELDWLGRLSRSQSANRVGMRGVLAAADGLAFANGGDFWEEFNAATRASMEDPADVSPVVLRGPTELVSSGLNWTIPNFPYDARVDERAEKLITRLAYGLPVPKEILLGMQAASRATAFQIDESGYRAHIEPPAGMIARVAEEALALMLPDAGRIRITADSSVLLARRHSVQDAKDAYDRGLVAGWYVRDVLAIPEEAEATEEDLARIAAIKSGTPEVDPGNAAADEPVTAAASRSELDALSEDLGNLDFAARAELAGASVLAADRAREKLGAQARTRPSLRGQIDPGTPNGLVAAELGLARLEAAGVAVTDAIASAVDPLVSWWLRRVDALYDATRDVLGEGVDPAFTETDRDRSAELLRAEASAFIRETAESAEPQELPQDVILRVLDTAGGEM